MKKNDTIKGIVIGVLTCGLLELGAILELAYLSNNNIIYIGGFPWGVIKYISPLVIIFLATSLLGIAIALKHKLLKKISITSVIVITLVITSGFIYIWWQITHTPPLDPNVFD